jgi:hypothetical protein
MDAAHYHRIFRAAIVEESIYDTYEEAITEFDHILSAHIEPRSACICTHPITNNCLVRSRVNGKVLVIGSSCIRNFFPPQMVTEATRLIRLAKRRTRDCVDCGRRIRKTEPAWKVRCLECYKRINQ